MGDVSRDIKPFRFWCQKVLPLVYDDSLSYYEVLCKIVIKLNEVIEATDGFDAALDRLKDLLQAEIAATAKRLTQRLTENVNNLQNQISRNVNNLQKQIYVNKTHIEDTNGKLMDVQQTLQAEITELQEWVEQFEWENLLDKVKDVVYELIPSQMSVRLDESGHIIIDYWRPWQDLVFGTTGYDADVAVQPEYGHLTVSY